MNWDWLKPLFKKGHNPYERICRKCGAHQTQMGTTYNRYTWWEEVYPVGNDPNCRCHKRAKYYP